MILVMFDIDGTLVDSDGFDSALYAQAVHEYVGADVDRSWLSYRHVTDSGVLQELLSAETLESDAVELAACIKRRFLELIGAHLARRQGTLVAIPGAPELFRELRSRTDVTVAIATGGWRESAELKLAAVGIDFANTPFATASEATSRADIMRHAEGEARSRGPFNRKIYVGDATWDQAACAQLGYEFVAVGSKLERAFVDLTDRTAIYAALGLAGELRSTS